MTASPKNIDHQHLIKAFLGSGTKAVSSFAPGTASPTAQTGQPDALQLWPWPEEVPPESLRQKIKYSIDILQFAIQFTNETHSIICM